MVIIPEWTYFQPEGEPHLHTIKSQKHHIAVEGVEEKEKAKIGLNLLGSDMFLYRTIAFHSGKAWPYLLILPGILVFVILLILRCRTLSWSLPSHYDITFSPFRNSCRDWNG